MSNTVLRAISAALLFAWSMIANPAIAQEVDERPVVGIAPIEDLTGGNQSDVFASMLETAIIGSGRFRIIERARVATLLEEQGLAQGGIATTNTPGRTGGFEGVDYLIYGTISSISAVQRSDLGRTIVGNLFGGGRRQDCSNTIVRLEADIRITDMNTGEVRYATRVSEIQESANICGGAAQFDASGLLRESADKVATGLVTSVFPIQVLTIQSDGTVLLNYGTGALEVGDFLMIYGESSEFPDPATGRMITVDGEQQGAIQVTDVQTAFSRAVQVTQFTVPLAVGAVARPIDEDTVEDMQRAQRRRR